MKTILSVAMLMGSVLTVSHGYADEQATPEKVLEGVFNGSWEAVKVELPPYDSEGSKKVCTAENTSAGVPNHSMISFCLSQSRSAYKDLQYFLKQNATFPKVKETTDAIIASNSKYGVINYEMVLFEWKQNKEGYDDLKYFYKKPDSDKEAMYKAIMGTYNFSHYINYNQADFEYKEMVGIPH